MRRYLGWIAGCGLAALLAGFWLFSQAGLQVGYLVVESGDGSPVPVGVALFSFSNQDGILVSEAGVGAVETLNSGRIFVDQRGTLTGLAMANPSSQTVNVDLTLRNGLGVLVGTRTETLDPNEHLPRNVNELFAGLASDFNGSLTFEVQDNREVAVVTLRQSFNREGETLLATLPVVDLSGAGAAGAGGAGTLVFPHLGAGTAAGITLATQIILINRTGQAASGEISFVGSNGQPLQLRVDEGDPASSVEYELAADGTFAAELSSEGAALQGYAVVTPAAGSPLPAGTAIFRYTDGAFPVSEAGVAAIPATDRARIFIDNDATMTGFALAGPGNGSFEVQLNLLDRNGMPVERPLRGSNPPAESSETSINLSADGHTSRFANDIFDLEDGFTGMLEISSDQPFVPITLKFTINQRGDFVLTTLPVADLNRLPQATRVVFPQIGLGPIPNQGEFSTRLIFINGDLESGLAGVLAFFGSDGSGLAIPLAGEVSGQFPYAIPAGTARQYFPGLFADLAAIVLDAQEVTINVGNSFSLHPIALDEEGNVRDDFVFEFESLAPETIAVNQFGRLTALNRGFANITVQARGVLEGLVANGATITQGGAAFEVSGVQGDAAGRLYLSSAADHVILLSEEVTDVPELFAGIRGRSGLVNLARLQSQFDEPSFSALDQGRGQLYVSDSGNHAIRTVPVGEAGTVSTLTGGSEGHRNGALAQAEFNNPQGLALDPKGRLWVADQGNHVIRLIDLVEETVTTLAGSPGNPGSDDGAGANARFDRPTGITLELEPLDQVLSRGPDDPEPPINMLVVDAGTGLIRRVREDGMVETLSPGTLESSHDGSAPRTKPAGGAPFRFSDPAGIVVDDFGNVYVSEPSNGRVRLLLRDGQIVPAAQEGTFGSPRQLTIVNRGRVLVAETRNSVQEIRYAGPSIEDVTPDRISNRGGDIVTVTGSNFARDTLVVFGGRLIRNFMQNNNRTIVFQAPELHSGRTVLTLHHRGGLDQTEILVDATPLEELNTGEITTIAGGSNDTGDGRFATSARFLFPFRAAADADGNLYVADPLDHRVRRVDAVTRIIRTVAGNGRAGSSGDGGPGPRAALNLPTGVAIAPSGDILILDAGNNAVRAVDPDTGIITTLIQDPLSQIPGVEGNSQIWDLAVNPAGGIFIADPGANRILRFDPGSEEVEIVAGNGTAGFNGDGTAVGVSLRVPQGVAIAPDGNLLIADTGNHIIRQVDLAGGQLTTLAGMPEQGGFAGENVPPLSALLRSPLDIFASDTENIWVADTGNHRIRRINLADNRIVSEAGDGGNGFLGDGGDALRARLSSPSSVAVTAGNQVFIVDSGNERVRAFSLQIGVISTYAGSAGVGIGDGGLATAASLSFPSGVAFDSRNNLYIADSNHHRIRRVFEPGRFAGALAGFNPLGTAGSTLQIETHAGSGVAGFSGDGGPPEDARFNSPLEVFVDVEDELFVADTFNDVVRQISQQSPAAFALTGTTAGSGVIFTIAGTGQPGFSGDGGPATQARLLLPVGMTEDARGNFYIADAGNDRIRQIDVEGFIRTIVGGQENLSLPQDVLFDGDNGLYIADSLNHRVVRFDLDSGAVTRVAGTGQAGFSGDSGLATRARLRIPTSLALSPNGRLLIADSGNGRVRSVNLAEGTITTVAGTGGGGFSGDNGPAVEARFQSVAGIGVDDQGNLFICDSNNHRVRAVRGPLP